MRLLGLASLLLSLLCSCGPGEVSNECWVPVRTFYVADGTCIRYIECEHDQRSGDGEGCYLQEYWAAVGVEREGADACERECPEQPETCDVYDPCHPAQQP